MSIRALIVDDEAHARTRLRQMLREESDVQIVAECANGRQALECIQKEKPDLVFLDIQMPRLTGFDLCDGLAVTGVPSPLIIFVTAYDEYALKAFEVRALDYLLKPFDRERLQKALANARERLRQTHQSQNAPELAALLEELKTTARKPGRLVFKENGRLLFVAMDAIDWVEADGNYVRVHAGSESHYFRETLTSLEGQLPSEKFIRISRSLLVNVDRIKELQPLFYGDYIVLLQDGARLNMTRAYRDRLEGVIGRVR